MKDFHTDNLYHERPRDEQIAGGALNPDHVAEYLRQHPDFFIDYENLLSELALPHHTGEHAISLVERQVSVLRTRNRDVRNRLNRLLETARDNDRSIRLLSRLGFVQMGEVTAVKPDGSTRPSLYWELEREAWEVLRAVRRTG